MSTTRAERSFVNLSADPATSQLWSGLSRRQVLELLVPGTAIGLLGGLVAGGLGALGGLSLALTLIAAVSLAVPLALAGALFDLLLTMGRVPLGPLAPMAMFWVIAFPICRAFNAATVNLTAGDPVAVPHGWLDFMVYNMLLSVGFAIGFWWLHQNFAPRWWFRLRDGNAVAAYFINSQLKFIGWQAEQRHAQRQERKDKRAAKAGRRAQARAGRRGRGGDAPLS
jgi:hypothetical protein